MDLSTFQNKVKIAGQWHKADTQLVLFSGLGTFQKNLIIANLVEGCPSFWLLSFFYLLEYFKVLHAQWRGHFWCYEFCGNGRKTCKVRRKNAVSKSLPWLGIFPHLMLFLKKEHCSSFTWLWALKWIFKVTAPEKRKWKHGSWGMWIRRVPLSHYATESAPSLWASEALPRSLLASLASWLHSYLTIYGFLSLHKRNHILFQWWCRVVDEAGKSPAVSPQNPFQFGAAPFPNGLRDLSPSGPPPSSDASFPQEW